MTVGARIAMKRDSWEVVSSYSSLVVPDNQTQLPSEHSSEDQPKVGGISSLIMFPSSVPREVEETGKRQRH